LEELPELIEKYEPMVFRTLARLMGKREGLDDLAQEVFLRLFRALSHFRGQSKLSTFLYRIIVNVVNDEWSRRQAARRMESIDEQTRELAHPALDPAEILEQSQFQHALEAGLAQLPIGDRTILALHYQEGRSYEEISAVLKLPMGTVKTHLHRARARLKEQMRDWISQCKATH